MSNESLLYGDDSYPKTERLVVEMSILNQGVIMGGVTPLGGSIYRLGVKMEIFLHVFGAEGAAQNF